MKRKASGVTKKPPLKRQRTTLALQKAILRARTDELKNVDVNSANTITFAQTTANLFLLNGISEGATATTRVGRKVVLTSLAWRWSGSVAATTTGGSGLRLLIVYDKQSNAAAPAATDVLTVDSIESPMNLNNSARFKVLLDFLVPCVGTAGPQAWNEKGYLTFEKPNKNKRGLEVTYNGNNTATITSITTGSIYALCYQNGNLLVANPPSRLYTRFRFLDA